MSALGFRQWIEDRVAEHDGNESAVARRIGVPPNYVHKWRLGQRPALDAISKALTAFGWELSPIAPGSVPLRANPIIVMGSIAAGAAVDVFEQLEELDGNEAVWEQSALWPHGFGQVRYLRVSGDSMEPEFPARSLIAVRQSNLKPHVIPDLSPVVLEDLHSHEMTFKLVQVERDKKGQPRSILGNPINRTHRTIVWQPGEVAVRYVVLGTLQTVGRRPISHPGPTMRASAEVVDLPPVRRRAKDSASAAGKAPASVPPSRKR